MSVLDTFFILRLANINAPEKKTDTGKKSLSALRAIVKQGDMIVIKTIKTDMYGRYVADVFLSQGKKDVQAIADEGVYLNQLLLDKGLVNRYEGL